MDAELIVQLLLILASGCVAGIVCRKLGVSMLVGYLLIGGALGVLFPWMAEGHGEANEVELFAEMGVLFLLFTIGLEFSLDELPQLARHLLFGGATQMFLVAAPVFGLALAWGLDWKPALLVGMAVSLSSTVLVFKALSEWGQTATPWGKRSISILLFQDIALVPMLLLVPLLMGTGAASTAGDYLLLVVVSILLVAGVMGLRLILRRWLIPLLASLRSPELVVLFTLLVLGGIAAGAHAAGLPAAIGALAAGLVFSGNRLTAQVDALMLPFRETFAAVFFVSLGLLLDVGFMWTHAGPLAAGLVGLLLLKSGAATVAFRVTGLGWQSAAAAGVGLSQMGEFSFVLVLQGLSTGGISKEMYQVVLSLALGSLIVTPQILKMALGWQRQDGEPPPESANWHHKGGETRETAVVIGAGPVGGQVASRLEIAGFDVCVVDLSPVNLHNFAQQGFRTVPGNASDPEVLQRASSGDARLFAVCVPVDTVAEQVVRTIRLINRDARILVRCRYLLNVATLKKAGAEAVISEEAEASDALLRLLNGLAGGKTSTRRPGSRH